MSTTLEGTPNPEAPNPQLPVVQKVRLRYTKRGRLRFTSHRDFARAFERAVRRAQVPVGFSSGFTPHPKISYANAAPTGSASEAEYCEIGLTRRVDPEQVRAALDDALPPGLDVVAAIEPPPGALADRLQASRWTIELPGVSPEHAVEAADRFLGTSEVLVERMTKRGVRSFDARAAVVSLDVHGADTDAAPCATLTVVIRHETPSVRPDDVLAALHASGGLELDRPPVATRSQQGPLDEQHGTVGDPLALDRDASQ